MEVFHILVQGSPLVKLCWFSQVNSGYVFSEAVVVIFMDLCTNILIQPLG